MIYTARNLIQIAAICVRKKDILTKAVEIYGETQCTKVIMSRLIAALSISVAYSFSIVLRILIFNVSATLNLLTLSANISLRRRILGVFIALSTTIPLSRRILSVSITYSVFIVLKNFDLWCFNHLEFTYLERFHYFEHCSCLVLMLMHSS